MFKLTAHAIQRFLERFPTQSLIDSIAFLQHEIETSKEMSHREVRKRKLNVGEERYYKSKNIIFIVSKDDKVITIWKRGEKKLPQPPRKVLKTSRKRK